MLTYYSFTYLFILWIKSQGSSLSQYSDWLQVGWPRFDFWQGKKIFLLASASRLAVWPTQLPFEWVPGVLSPGVKQLGCEADHWLLLVPRSRKSAAIPLLPQTSAQAWCLNHGHLKRHWCIHSCEWTQQHIHSAEHWYSCDVCDKSFSSTCYLKRHQHVHIGQCP